MGRTIDSRTLYAACGLAWITVTLHAIFAPPPPYEPQASADELGRFAIATLAKLQRDSIERNQEFCGVIVESDDGVLSASRIYEGGRADCSYYRMSQPGTHVVASFHTHGGTDRDYDSEFPSLEDVEGDMEEQIAGFIATPGGRVWQVDWRTGVASQFCGVGCLQRDPDYGPDSDETPSERYSLAQLRERAAATDDLFVTLPARDDREAPRAARNF